MKKKAYIWYLNMPISSTFYNSKQMVPEFLIKISKEYFCNIKIDNTQMTLENIQIYCFFLN